MFPWSKLKLVYHSTQPHDASTSGAEAGSPPVTTDSKKIPASSAGTTGQTPSKDETSKSKLLIPKSAILRLLAELVMSYAGIAQAVAQYQYMVGQAKHVKEVCGNVLGMYQEYSPITLVLNACLHEKVV